MKINDKIVVVSGRLKGEKGTVIGFSNLNMEHKIIVSRANQRARSQIMGFNENEITLRGK